MSTLCAAVRNDQNNVDSRKLWLYPVPRKVTVRFETLCAPRVAWRSLSGSLRKLCVFGGNPKSFVPLFSFPLHSPFFARHVLCLSSVCPFYLPARSSVLLARPFRLFILLACSSFSSAAPLRWLLRRPSFSLLVFAPPSAPPQQSVRSASFLSLSTSPKVRKRKANHWNEK